MKYLDYFGGKTSFQESLVKLAKRRREELKISYEQLDQIAGLGVELPNCKEYEQDPTQMTQYVLSAIGLPLKINIDGTDLTNLAKQEMPCEKTLEIIIGALSELAD